MKRITQAIVISLLVCFLMSVTASAGPSDIGHDKGHHVLVHEDNGNGNDGLNNGQGNDGTPGYENQQDGVSNGEHMGSEYRLVHQ